MTVSPLQLLGKLGRFFLTSAVLLLLIPMLAVTLIITVTVKAPALAAETVIGILNTTTAEEDIRAQEWIDRIYPQLEKYNTAEYSQYYLAAGISCWSYVRKGERIPPNTLTIQEYMEYFRAGNALDITDTLIKEGILHCTEEEKLEAMSLGQQLRLEAVRKDSFDQKHTEWQPGKAGNIPQSYDYPNYTDYWNTVLDFPGQPFTAYGGQCTSYAWYRFYQCYGYPSGAQGDGKYNAETIVNAHPDQFTLSSVPKAGSVFSGYRGYSTNQHGHVGFIEEVTDKYIYTSEGNMCPDESGSNGQIWEYHRWDINTFMNRYNDGHPDSYLIFAVPIS